MEDSTIKICTYVKELIDIRNKLSFGMSALTKLYDLYGDDESPFSADDFLETRDTLAEMENYVADEILRIIENRIASAEKRD